MNTRKLHQTGVKKQEEMKNTEESIEKEKKNLPVNYSGNISVSDSGMMALSGGRSKGIDEI